LRITNVIPPSRSILIVSYFLSDIAGEPRSLRHAPEGAGDIADLCGHNRPLASGTAAGAVEQTHVDSIETERIESPRLFARPTYG
jgi:hypothetical protein